MYKLEKFRWLIACKMVSYYIVATVNTVLEEIKCRYLIIYVVVK